MQREYIRLTFNLVYISCDPVCPDQSALFSGAVTFAPLAGPLLVSINSSSMYRSQGMRAATVVTVISSGTNRR